MNGKPLNGKGNGFSVVATLSPGDFPLGSMLSRAAARSMLAKFDMPQDDDDAMCLFGGACLLTGDMTPRCSDLERTTAYARGAELCEDSDTPGVDFWSEGSTAASNAFRLGFGRAPQRGDLLRYEDVKFIRNPAWHVWWVKRFIAAWQRQIPGLPCPLKVEDDSRVFRRLSPTDVKYNDGYEWREDIEHCHSAEKCWRDIEREAKCGIEALERREPPAIAGVVFLSTNQWRPATKRELNAVEIEPSGGLIGLLAKIATRTEDIT